MLKREKLSPPLPPPLPWKCTLSEDAQACIWPGPHCRSSCWLPESKTRAVLPLEGLLDIGESIFSWVRLKGPRALLNGLPQTVSSKGRIPLSRSHAWSQASTTRTSSTGRHRKGLLVRIALGQKHSLSALFLCLFFSTTFEVVLLLTLFCRCGN